MDPGHSLRVGHSWSRRGTALAGNSLVSRLEGSESRWGQINGRTEGIKAPCDSTWKCEAGCSDEPESNVGVPGVEQLPGERGTPRVAAGDPFAGRERPPKWRRSRTEGVGCGVGAGGQSMWISVLPGGSDVEAERKSSESESRP